MAAHPSPGITLTKLRDGAPDALAALCRLRGAAIVAYSTQMAGSDHAVEAAAESFAQFRLAAITPGALTNNRQAEPLLRGAARRAVLAHVLEAAAADEGDVLSGECRTRADQLLGYVENSLPAGERETVDDHVRYCRVCATTLQRLQEGEAAFGAVDGPLPGWVGKRILTAIVDVAPLGESQADPIAVRDEALELLIGLDEGRLAAAEPAPETEPVPEIEPEPEPERSAVPGPEDAALPPLDVMPWEDGDWPDEPDPALDSGLAPPTARVSAPTSQASRRSPRFPRRASGQPPARTRLRARLSRNRPVPFARGRSAMLARGLLGLVALVAVLAAVGVLLGIGLSKLSGDDAAAPAPSTPSIPSTPATPSASTEKLLIEVVSTTVRPLTGGGGEQASVRVHIRVENATGRTVPGEAPQLLVDDDTVELARSSRSTAGGLLTSSRDPDASADGTLRFDVASMTASELRDARVRLRIFRQVVALTPELRAPARGG